MAEKLKPLFPEGYASELSGNWGDVPEWAIARINFLELTAIVREKQRCPRGDKDCPSEPTMSCSAIKHCYPHICDGSCGHNEIWVSNEEKQILKNNRR